MGGWKILMMTITSLLPVTSQTIVKCMRRPQIKSKKLVTFEEAGPLGCLG